MSIVHGLQFNIKIRLVRLLLGLWLLSAFSPIVSANSDRFRHYEFGRTDAKYAVNIELNKLDKLYIRHGAAIDGFIYTYRSDGQNYQIGGDGGALSTIDLNGLTKVVVHIGNFYWGSTEKATIVKIEFHYRNGEQHTFGSTQYATSVIKNEHLVRPELLSLSFWPDGWLINGVRFKYPRSDKASIKFHRSVDRL
jgi:hypothetical protein